MSSERRQFFRIEKDVALEVSLVSQQEADHSTLPTQFEVSPYFSLLTDLRILDAEYHTLIQQLAEENPTLAALFNLQDRKLNHIVRTLTSSGLALAQLTQQNINLSEGGLQFSSPTPFNLGDYVSVKLIFSNPLLGVCLFAKVQRCIAEEDGYQIAVAFYRLPENGRRLIAQRVLQSQTKHPALDD